MHGYASGPTAADADVVGKRVGAAIVDSIIGFALYMMLARLFLGSGLSSGSVLMAFFLLPFAVFAGYYIFFEGMLGSATIGKRLFGIEVVTERGRPVTVEDAVVRNVLRFVDGICYYAVGFFFMTTSDRNQRLGDRLASAVVVASDATHGPGHRQSHPSRPHHSGGRAGRNNGLGGGGGRTRQHGGRAGLQKDRTGQHGTHAESRGTGGQAGQVRHNEHSTGTTGRQQSGDARVRGSKNRNGLPQRSTGRRADTEQASGQRRSYQSERSSEASS